jgi:hypothetical protein
LKLYNEIGGSRVGLWHSSAVHREGGVHGVVTGSNPNYTKSVSLSTFGVNTCGAFFYTLGAICFRLIKSVEPARYCA